MKRFKVIFKFLIKSEKKLAQINLLFIFIFLIIWDFINNKQFFNAMTIGMVLFGPATFLWFVGTVRAAALIVLVSIFEFMVLLIFVAEGFELGGVESTLKSIFWIPYLLMAGINGFWGLKIYSECRENRITRHNSK
ncbi:hypothetical protein A2164_03575 [Candidatus Curtissbacteria bacterium RBG_13_35_7]|uniref:Uncharacterized protein n=1 Tax=Candidatus Curtissbacteria bacterium RBG_13_35_7 TaxID=1797705 RepID=A0A1F5G4E1_9BACT|nr:MAG: hypothetical protein A2164_03575 [Candidatus Curtissbacteria bacterium RBG_13_35_7]